MWGSLVGDTHILRTRHLLRCVVAVALSLDAVGGLEIACAKQCCARACHGSGGGVDIRTVNVLISKALAAILNPDTERVL
eukprot:473755-Rhodomonas_salina.1